MKAIKANQLKYEDINFHSVKYFETQIEDNIYDFCQKCWKLPTYLQVGTTNKLISILNYLPVICFYNKHLVNIEQIKT